MSLWTPGGEHHVPDPESLTPEQEAQAEQLAGEMAEVRKQLLSVPAAMVVANHAMGLYELAAIHLGAETPNLEESRVAIDAFGALVESLGDRLGDDSGTLRDALGQIRLAYVQVKGALESEGAEAGAAEAAEKVTDEAQPS